jgi:hypothetical protein
MHPDLMIQDAFILLLPVALTLAAVLVFGLIHHTLR